MLDSVIHLLNNLVQAYKLLFIKLEDLLLCFSSGDESSQALWCWQLLRLVPPATSYEDKIQFDVESPFKVAAFRRI